MIASSLSIQMHSRNISRSTNTLLFVTAPVPLLTCHKQSSVPNKSATTLSAHYLCHAGLPESMTRTDPGVMRATTASPKALKVRPSRISLTIEFKHAARYLPLADRPLHNAVPWEPQGSKEAETFMGKVRSVRSQMYLRQPMFCTARSRQKDACTAACLHARSRTEAGSSKSMGQSLRITCS